MNMTPAVRKFALTTHIAFSVGWLPTEVLQRSNELLKDGNYSAKDFVDLVNELYPQAGAISPDVRVNREALENSVVINWLILPQETREEKIEEDADRTKDWKCRDIPFQYTIFAGFEKDEDYHSPKNKTELREFENRYGITIYAYEYQNAVRDNLIIPITFSIGFEDVQRPYVSSSHYNLETGLNFAESYEDNII